MNPKYSPWGSVQHVTVIIQEHVISVSTASHGGVKLDRKYNALVPEYMRREGGWYEEDCEYAIPFVVFESELKEHADQWTRDYLATGKHWDTFKGWYPDEYERFTGKTLQPGESYIKDERAWKAEHANDLQVISAWGSWQPGVAAGMVGVCACVGGRGSRSAERWFLIPEAEYDARGQHRYGFIVDPSRHTEVADFTRRVA